MSPLKMRMGWPIIILGCIAFVGKALAEPAIAPEASSSAWTISASPSVRQIHKVSFNTASTLQGGSQRVFSGLDTVGPADSFANRTYDDGNVNIDIATATDGRTWYWGYDTPSQVQDGNLTFHSLSGRSMFTQVTGAEADWSSKDDMEAGARLTAERSVWQRGNLSAGLLCGVDYTRVSAGNSIQGTWAKWRQDQIIVDSYPLSGINPPTPPYEGSFDVPGPLINNIPATRSTLTDTQPVARGPLTISDSLDADVITASLGVSLRGEVGMVRIGGSIGPSFSFIPLRADHAETCAAAAWDKRDSESDNTFEPGFFGQADVDVALYKNIGLRLSGRYDWINEIEGDVGPSHYEVDVSGFSLSFGLYADI